MSSDSTHPASLRSRAWIRVLDQLAEKRGLNRSTLLEKADANPNSFRDWKKQSEPTRKTREAFAEVLEIEESRLEALICLETLFLEQTSRHAGEGWMGDVESAEYLTDVRQEYDAPAQRHELSEYEAASLLRFLDLSEEARQRIYERPTDFRVYREAIQRLGTALEPIEALLRTLWSDGVLE